MNKTRIEFLRETLVTKPDDTFTRYALALELSKSDTPEDAWEHFDYLLSHHPEYSATYYQAGTFLAARGRRDEARKILAKGIEVTTRQGNLHAQSELQKALDGLGA
jgi:tetratricopeptide (TPR) repeat protein